MRVKVFEVSCTAASGEGGEPLDYWLHALKTFAAFPDEIRFGCHAFVAVQSCDTLPPPFVPAQSRVWEGA